MSTMIESNHHHAVISQKKKNLQHDEQNQSQRSSNKKIPLQCTSSDLSCKLNELQCVKRHSLKRLNGRGHF